MRTLSPAKPITIAIAAMGGQGGGVLAQWIVTLAEINGWRAQSTSVPGVAQRTGATLYYIEMIEAQSAAIPLFSLMPAPGDVDIVLAAEFMEAGRAMLRGLVTPERTVLIASTHRALALAEKQGPKPHIGSSATVVEAALFAAKRVIAFDMDTLAKQSGSVISSCLFGALAGSQVLPFGRSDFEAVIRQGGKGIDASLRAFSAAFTHAGGTVGATLPPTRGKRFPSMPIDTGSKTLELLAARILGFPLLLHPMLTAGVARLVDYQDADYATDYLDHVAQFLAFDCPEKDWVLTLAAAKYVAGAMAYDDVISVADLKTRRSRFERVRREIAADPGQIVLATEYMRPRAEEAIGLLPEKIGRWIEARPRVFRAIDKIVNRGRRVQTFKIGGFTLLYIVSSLRAVRRRTLRHARESHHLRQWRDLAIRHSGTNYDLAVEILRCRRLVKGYSDTHARGTSKFDCAMGAVPLLSARPDGALWMRRLLSAAQMDESGQELDGAIKTLRQLQLYSP